MSTKTSYTYTVLRYVHDTATGEFVNVGVALHAPAQCFVHAQCRTSYGRIRDTFPTFDGEGFRRSMRYVLRCFDGYRDELQSPLQMGTPAGSIMDFALRVMAKDDSSLQWSAAGSGLTRDPQVELAHLYDRFVMSNESRHGPGRRHDDDIWRHFSSSLEQRQVLRYLTPKTISVRDDELKFKHAWKNGLWHCLAPVSFDLGSADSIKEKAHRWLGQVTSVAESSEDFKLYFLVGEPSQTGLQPAYESALSILRKSPVSSEIFAESEAPALSEKLAAEVTAHLDSGLT